MDTEEDYFSGMDSEEEVEDEGGYPDDDDDYVDSESDDFDDTDDPESNNQLNYTILNEEEIRARQEEDIANITSVLSVSRVSAIALLYHYNWNVGNVNDAWFADEEKVRATIGLLDNPIVHYNGRKSVCRICFDKFARSGMASAACGHLFCKICWKSYISIAISDGPGCLMLRCPDPECRAAVGQDMVDELVEEEDREKYSRYLVRSYVESSKKIKWCPAPGCDYAVDFVVGSGGYDVSCKCTRGFCWNCVEEAHRPVDCETVAKWIMKNSAESENTNWILANSKPCPKCKRPIQKNQGCMHMTCTPPCKFEFCWLCLGAWSEHGERTGGYYACNHYEKEKQEGKYAESERIREMAKSVIEKYTHYYERWAANESSKKKAIADLKQLQDVNIKKLSNLQCQTELQLNFILEAWQQIIECRHLLKWTYAYGYYLPDNELAKKRFYEFLQNEAESWLERLHLCAEKELQVYLKEDLEDSADFSAFRSKLLDLTVAARNYFDKLVRALENGLADVDSSVAMDVDSSVPMNVEEVEDRFENSYLAAIMNQD